MDTLVITDKERALRIEAVDYARASIRLEGFVLDDEIERLNTLYVDGLLTSAEHSAAIVEWCGPAR